jgi:hypothetical protein
MALKRSYAAHVIGSHFWHGSHTYMGGRFDTHLIAAIMYSVQDVLVGGFANSNTILTQLSETPRSMSASQFAANLTALGVNASPNEWTRFIVESDYPQDYFTLFAAFVGTTVSLILPWNITNWAITSLCNLLVPGEPSKFMVEKYLPALGENVKHFSISFTESAGVASKFAAVLIKIGYAFLWQEEFVPTQFLWHPITMNMAVSFAPYVYSLADHMSGFSEQDQEMNTMGKVFPGDKFCRIDSPHALWHEVSANALMNFAYLANHVNGLARTYTAKGPVYDDPYDPMIVLSIGFDVVHAAFN